VSSLADLLIARMAAQRDLLREIDERCSSISARAASPDESVRVEVDGLGCPVRRNVAKVQLELQAIER
jgi:hypothetical protein